MNSEELIELWRQEEKEPFSGWDFSHLDGRMLEEDHPWSYTLRAVELMRHCSSMLDMGTGGAERLLTMKDAWPRRVTATEDYPPNVVLAKNRLIPFGITVVDISLSTDHLMPFGDNEFDIVLNRHSGLNPEEVARILAQGGVFLTQQVHGQSLSDLMALFDSESSWPFATPEFYVPRLKAAGLTIHDFKEWSGKMSFVDVGALVYYLKAVPWVVPGFSVATHLRYLLSLQRQLEEGKALTFTNKRYLIEARKTL